MGQGVADITAIDASAAYSSLYDQGPAPRHADTAAARVIIGIAPGLPRITYRR